MLQLFLCRILKGSLDRGGIECFEINTEETPDAMDFLMSVNGDNHTVPTAQCPSGAALTNPSLSRLNEQLAI